MQVTRGSMYGAGSAAVESLRTTSRERESATRSYPPPGQQFIDKSPHARVVVRVVVKGNPGIRCQMRLEVPEVAGDVFIIVQTVHKQKRNRTVPLHLVRALANSMYKLFHTRRSDIRLKTSVRRLGSLQVNSGCTDSAFMGVDGVETRAGAARSDYIASATVLRPQ